jgi:hypothetical protein
MERAQLHPQIATADGGLIASCLDPTTWTSTTVTFGQNGVRNGMIAQLPTYSWIGDAYQPGSATQVAAFPVTYVSSFLAMVDANNSGNGTAFLQTPYPPLPSCYNTTLKPPIPCPGPAEALKNALASLRTRLNSACPACQTYVFNILGHKQQDFASYLSLAPGFFDGSKSNAELKFLCGRGPGVGGFLNYAFCGGPPLPPACQSVKTVSEYMSCINATAVSQTPSNSGRGLTTFFDPSAVKLSDPSTPQGILNQATVFHEALHGFYGAWDGNLLSDFGYNAMNDPSCKITDYLELNIWGGTLEACE